MDWNNANKVHPDSSITVLCTVRNMHTPLKDGKPFLFFMLAQYFNEKECECDCDYDCNCDYDEDKDLYYMHGWHEIADISSDYSTICLGDHYKVIAWQGLPMKSDGFGQVWE